MEPHGGHHSDRCDTREHLTHTNIILDAKLFLIRFSGKEVAMQSSAKPRSRF